MSEHTVAGTRRELGEYLAGTFARLGLVQRSDIVAELRRQGASDEAIDLVAERVPEGVRLTDLRVLWTYLGDVPLDRESG